MPNANEGDLRRASVEPDRLEVDPDLELEHDTAEVPDRSAAITDLRGDEDLATVRGQLNAPTTVPTLVSMREEQGCALLACRICTPSLLFWR